MNPISGAQMLPESAKGSLFIKVYSEWILVLATCFFENLKSWDPLGCAIVWFDIRYLWQHISDGWHGQESSGTLRALRAHLEGRDPNRREDAQPICDAGPALAEKSKRVTRPGKGEEHAPKWMGHWFPYLVGGLVAIFYFPIYWVANHPNWLIFFRGVAQPPTRYWIWTYCIWSSRYDQYSFLKAISIFRWIGNDEDGAQSVRRVWHLCVSDIWMEY